MSPEFPNFPEFLDRHSRESGNLPGAHLLDSRFRGNDELIDNKSLNLGFYKWAGRKDFSLWSK